MPASPPPPPASPPSDDPDAGLSSKEIYKLKLKEIKAKEAAEKVLEEAERAKREAEEAARMVREEAATCIQTVMFGHWTRFRVQGLRNATRQRQQLLREGAGVRVWGASREARV